MNKKIVWTIFLAAMAVAGIWAYTKIKKLLVEYDKTFFLYSNFKANFFALVFGGAKNLQGTFDFTIDNQGELNMEMTKLKLWVYVGGEKAAHIVSTNNVMITPHSKTTQQLSFNTPIELIKPLTKVVAGNFDSIKQLDVVYKGTLWVKTTLGSIPLPFTDNYKLGELM